jgi:hypothetical protein
VGSFELVAQGEKPPGPIVARAFLVRGDALLPWPGDLELSPQGSVRIVDSATKLIGATELRLVVARSPGDAEARARGSETSGRGWRVLRCAIE